MARYVSVLDSNAQQSNDDDDDNNRRSVMDRLYSPSRWTKRMSPDVVVVNHIDFITTASSHVAKTLASRLNIKYGDSERQAYDVHYDENTSSEGKPIVVFVHGGYWQALSKDAYSFIAEHVVRCGGIFVSVDYDLCPDVTMTEITRQIRCAIEHIGKMASIQRSSGIYLVGHSAGAQLSIMALASEYCPRLLKGAVLVSGVYDLRPLLETSENAALRMTEPEAWTLSPLNPDVVNAVNRHRREASIVVAIAEHDSPPFRQQAQLYHQLLTGTSSLSSISLIDIPKVDHFDIVELLSDSEFSLTKVIVDMMNANAVSSVKGTESAD